MIKRLSGLDVAVPEMQAALNAFQRNLGLQVDRVSSDTEVVLTIAGAAIRLVVTPQPDTPGAEKQGMIGLWLEAQDVEAVAASLVAAGFERPPLKTDGKRRVLDISPPGFTEPWLFIFDRKA
jgi:hypothetical protein